MEGLRNMVSTIKYNLDLGGGSLMQIANRSVSQMMSYLIDCPNGDVYFLAKKITIDMKEAVKEIKKYNAM